MAVYPGGSNTFVPSYEASGKLQVEFSRNPNAFALNKYAKVKQVKKSQGKYLSITAEEAGRVVNLQDSTWEDGQDDPTLATVGTEKFEFLPYDTTRHSFGFRLGQRGTEQADWDIVASHGRIKAQQAMTHRTKDAVSVLNTSGNWSGNTATATASGGGKWNASSATDQFILRAFNATKESIWKSTLGAVSPDALMCVIPPNVASALRISPEILDFIKQSPGVLEVIRQDKDSAKFFTRWGIPPELYGVKMVVEDAVQVTTKKNTGSATRAYAFSDDNAVFCSRIGELDGGEFAGEADFSTVSIFVYEDMTVETRNDPDNRRILGRVVDDYDVVITAPASGYLVTDLL